MGTRTITNRVRKFSCITYLNEKQLELALFAHREQIKVYAYALHDNDKKDDGTLKEPHYHLILITYNQNTCSAIRRWFKAVDSSGQEITTTAQICGDVYEMYDYLIHRTKECIAKNKYQYDEHIRVSNDHKYFKGHIESDWDNIQLCAEKLLNGANPRDLARIFGRDFILHYNQIKSYVADVVAFECNNDVNTIRDYLQKFGDRERW